MKLPFIEIIEMLTPDPNLLMWKYADEDKEIKNGAHLTVRESQEVMLINEGQTADIFKPGLHKLSTNNTPFLSKLKGWKYGFESPFKADVYFFNTNQFLNNKWGTPAPILMRDSEFGHVRVRAFGSYDFKIIDVTTFFRQYAGTYPRLTLLELQNSLRDYIAPSFGEALAEQQISVIDVAGNLSSLNEKIEPYIKEYYLQLGVELTKFRITSVTLPPEVTEYYDTRTNMNILKDMEEYKQFNTANAIGEAKGFVGGGVQDLTMMGIMMNQMQQMQNNNTAQQNQQNAPSQDNDIAGKLQKLKTLFDNELIDEAEYKAKKQQLLSEL